MTARTPGPARAPAVGTDVVDAALPRCRGKSADDRFVARVLTEAEAAAVRDAADPDRALWLRWAAKESAFKVATALRGDPPVFEHRAFEVDVAADGAGGRGRWEELVVFWRLWDEPGEGGLHVVAWADGPTGRPRLEAGAVLTDDDDDISLHRLTERELRSVHSPASGAVRLRARSHLARLEGVEETEVEIVTDEGPAGRMPPRALLHGEPARWGVSLSHHGRLLAWALARWPESQRVGG